MHQTARLAYPYQVSMNENPPTPQSNIDLVGIEQDLADVEIALSRLLDVRSHGQRHSRFSA